MTDDVCENKIANNNVDDLYNICLGLVVTFQTFEIDQKELERS